MVVVIYLDIHSPRIRSSLWSSNHLAVAEGLLYPSLRLWNGARTGNRCLHQQSILRAAKEEVATGLVRRERYKFPLRPEWKVAVFGLVKRGLDRCHLERMISGCIHSSFYEVVRIRDVMLYCSDGNG